MREGRADDTSAKLNKKAERQNEATDRELKNENRAFQERDYQMRSYYEREYRKRD